MERQYVDMFVEQVVSTIDALKIKNVVPDSDLIKTAVDVVDKSHKEGGFPGLVKVDTTQDFDNLIKSRCLIEPLQEGPMIYLYTCYPKGDDPNSNTAGFTTYQLQEFAKNHKGLPIHINHDTDLPPAGFTLEGGINKKGELMGGFVLYNSPMGRLAHKLIESAGVRAVSIGAYHQEQIVDEVPMKTHAAPHEVSICVLGDMEGTKIHGKMSWSDRYQGENAKLLELPPLSMKTII